MLTMTQAAAGYLNKVLEEAKAPPDTAVRLVVEANRVRSALDTARPGDTSLDHEGRKVLLLDERASQALAERTLDLQSTDEGPKLGIG